MEKREQENFSNDELIDAIPQPDETVIKIYEGRKGDYYFKRENERGEIIEFAPIDSDDKHSEIKDYFANRGIVLTDKDLENIKDRFYRAKEEKVYDAVFESMKDDSTEQ